MASESPEIPVSVEDPINQRILTASEDQIQGFQDDPFEVISHASGVYVPTVLQRLRAMLEAGTIRRIRQTLMTTNLAPGALVAWEVEPDHLNPAFDWMFQEDPFTGHVVIRTTDSATPGSNYRLWTTLKVPQGFSMKKHCDFLASKVGAARYRIMPAKRLFALGVGHLRRREIEPGSRSDQPAEVHDTNIVQLSEEEWKVLMALKREFAPEEIRSNPWATRAKEAGVACEDFLRVGHALDERGVIGRFSTFLEHVKKHRDGRPVTRYNALFHWAVPPGREMDAGLEVGRHEILTHAYWREGGEEFRQVNVMAVAHGLDRDLLLAHKAAIDRHLEEAGIPVLYTNVFWGGRSEIKPSEISPQAYREWCQKMSIDPQQMRE